MSPQIAPAVAYASLWRRLGASIVDQIALTIVNFIVVLILGIALGILMIDLDVKNVVAPVINLISSLLGLLLHWLYYAVMESSETQATFGKMLFGIQVSSMQKQRLSFTRATGRYWAKVLFQLLCTIISVVLVLIIGLALLPTVGRENPTLAIIIVCLIAVVVSIVVYAGGILAFYLYSPHRQIMHDMMAKTIVIRKPTGLGQISE